MSPVSDSPTEVKSTRDEPQNARDESQNARGEPQSAGAVLMVRPARFGFNAETAASNEFQRCGSEEFDAAAAALIEFDSLVERLRTAGVRVLVAEDTPQPHKPDAVFPNNWVSLHADGTQVLYPMLAPNRRLERREDMLAQVLAAGGYRPLRTVDLSHREAYGKYLEGTGSLVLDRRHRIAYACLSPRTDLDVLGEFAQRLDYELVIFEAEGSAGLPIYHTNVVMSVGEGFAVLCAQAIVDPERRTAVESRLVATGHEVVHISMQQMQCFAANILELRAARGPLIALSTTAMQSLDETQRTRLARHAELLPVHVPLIERLGGGGVRCMLAEIHLPAHAA